MDVRISKETPRLRLLCPHCGADNPPRAYCCLSCFKVMQGADEKKRRAKRIPLLVLLSFVISGLGYMLLVSITQWVDHYPTHLEALHRKGRPTIGNLARPQVNP